MLFFLLAVFAVSLAGVKFSGANEFHKDYLSKDSTAAVNGIFVLLVFLKHVCDRADLTAGVFDKPYLSFGEGMGQLVVVTFLFYSGYGIMRSIMSKGHDYVKAIPKKRFLKVLVQYDVAVLLYAALNLILKNKMKFWDLLLSFVGWSSIGNSNWYVFSILSLYLIVFVSFFLFKGKIYPSLALSVALTLGLIALLFSVRRPAYFYNTLVCYCLGMIYAAFKEKIDKAVMKNDVVWLSLLSAVGISFAFSSLSRHVKTFPHCLWAILFALLVVLLTMKLQFKNELLEYFGKHVFSIYILQRIPMMIFEKVPKIYANAYVYIAVCFVCTLLISEVFDRGLNRIGIKKQAFS